MANWKEVALTDNVPNLGNTSLKSEASNRSFTLKQTAGSTASRKFTIGGERAADNSISAALTITASNFTSDGTGVPLHTHNYNGNVMVFAATSILSFNSANIWSCAAPNPVFTCDQLQIYNQDTGSAANPTLALTRQPPSGDDDYGEAEDNLGVIVFEGEDSGGVTTTYASIESSIVDATNATEDGRLDIRLMNAGTVASAVKILPKVADTVTGKLDSLEVYAATLKDLLIGFQKYSLKTSFKMYLNPQYAYGFQPLHGYIMSLKPGDDGQNNASYIIEPDDMTAFSNGTTFLDGVAGDALSSYQDGDDVGYGDAWLTYDHPADAPAVTIELSGHVWWKPRMDPPSGQSISFWYAHEDFLDGFVDDINEDTGVQFLFKNETSTFTLSDGEEVTKMPFSFSQNIGAANGFAKQHMFLLGGEIKSTGTVDFIGQATTTESVNYNNMVADVTMRVYPQ